MSDCCDICGIGFYLPSRVCDHCDSKADDHPSTPRPITTAPKDGTRLLVFTDELWDVGWWSTFRECWISVDFYEIFPTHWLPVPPSPL